MNNARSHIITRRATLLIYTSCDSVGDTSREIKVIAEHYVSPVIQPASFAFHVPASCCPAASPVVAGSCSAAFQQNPFLFSAPRSPHPRVHDPPAIAALARAVLAR